MISQNLFSNSDWLFAIYVLVTGILAGNVAAISGFGIGSLLTPLLSIKLGTKLAIAVVSIPHFIGTVIRFWLLKANVDKKILVSFGISSVIGGLVGALLFWKFTTPALTIIFASILIFAGVMEFSGLSHNLRVGKKMATIGGILSGFLGGLVGNQGGIRSAALLSFDINRKAFVATATAIGLIVDTIRMPIYFVSQGTAIITAWDYILIATIGVLLGTWIGLQILDKIPKEIFRRIIASLIILLGIVMLVNHF